MNNKRFILSALTLGAAMLVGCPGPAVVTPDAGPDGGPPGTDGGRDTGTTVDTGVHPADGGADTGTVVMTDAGVPLTCAGLCAQVTAACAGALNPYTDTATCMTQCTATMWTVGTEADTSGNTLGCRIYHSIVAGGAGMAATHCPHTGLLGGGVCSPFRSDPATEVTVTGTAHAAGYLRVDRMGMPAVSTALMPDAASKNGYNDSNPTRDASLVPYGPVALSSLVGLHNALDGQLRSLNFTPCSTRLTPALGTNVPYCAAQTFGGTAPVAALILPDTLRLDPTLVSGGNPVTFPNGRALADPVIDVTLGVLLLSTQYTCDPASPPVAVSPHGSCFEVSATNCTALNGCEMLAGQCQYVDCESRTTATACTLTPGCQVTHCGTGTTPCTAGSFVNLGANGGLSQRPNDGTFSTTFPYFAPAWPAT